ncbi:MAG TPA: hypothetical protein VKD67_08090, partial [Acidimicrobiales bacterium]|nr:hypothetical protein [Acidimicrobiales bacterium]
MSRALSVRTATLSGTERIDAPAHVAPPERLAMVRILVSVYAVVWLLAALPGLIGLMDADPARWDPVGVLGWIDAPLSTGWVWVVIAVALASGVAFAAGAAARITGPVLAAAFLLVTTYRSSWGQIFHTDDLVALQLVVLAFAPAAHAWSWDARHRRTAPPP